MEVHRDLYVRGTPEGLTAFIERVTERGTGEWQRDRDAEQRIPSPADDPFYCFGHLEKGGAATLVLSANQEGALYVTNVVPVPPRTEMSRAECNAVIERFYELALPVAGETNVEITMTGAQRGIDADLSPEALRKLQAFSGAANKSTGAEHPNDHRRWMDFVIHAHLDGTQFDEETLARWLYEEDGWEQKMAWKLAGTYRDERALLARYDAVR